MNYALIKLVLAYMCYGLAAVMLVPAAVAASYGEDVFVMGLSCTLALIAGRFFQRQAQAWQDISLREGLFVMVFGWLLLSLLGSTPYLAAGVLGPLDAFFESISGFTTTGATVLKKIDGLPAYLLLWRSLTNWIGGITIISIFVAVLPQLAKGSVYLFNAEAGESSEVRFLPRLRSTAIAVFYIYFMLTVILMGCLVSLGLSKFDALNYALCTLSTGGFAPHTYSVAYLQSPGLEFVLALFMILAGGNFALYYYLSENDFSVIKKNVEFKVYLAAIGLATLLIAGNLVFVGDFSPLEALRHAFFQAASFCTTTGFASRNYDQWPAFSKLILGLLFLLGGCSGSTAGGLKVNRFIVLVKSVTTELRRTLHPRLLLGVAYQGKTLDENTVIYISRFFFIYIFIGAAFTLGLTGVGLPTEDAIFGVFACLASLGPAFGSLGVAATYAQVPVFGKLLLILAMLIGRMELITALVLLRREYWRTSRHW